jgi:MoaA/NifB/PqqE/SkfB family radical SAM enzyme
MSSLVSISDALPSEVNENLEAHVIRNLPVIVLSPHNRCNCRCMMCDIWRIQESRDITPEDLQPHVARFRDLGVKWIVFSGGETQLNRRWSELASLLRAEGIRITILTAGLLLESEAATVAASVDDIIVSLDGPPEVHNRIRRVPHAFEQIAAGISAIRKHRPEIIVRARCTVQKANHDSLRTTVQAAKQLELTSISFLAVDPSSEAFNRQNGWSEERQERVLLNVEEVERLDYEIEHLISEYGSEMQSGFITEKPEKLRKILRHFRACLGTERHVAPRCNAPWVSAVIEASGDVRPCFFHASIGNIHRQSLPDIINGSQALKFRANLDIASNPICQKCVCSLHLPR